MRVHYSGWTTDGKLFDSSVARGEPAEFSLNGVIKGWTEGVRLMVVGDKTRFWIPGELAHGNLSPRRPRRNAGLRVVDPNLRVGQMKEEVGLLTVCFEASELARLETTIRVR